MVEITEDEATRRRTATATILAAIAQGILDGTFKEFKFDSRENRKKIVSAYTGKAINNGVPIVDVSFEMRVDGLKFYQYVRVYREGVVEELQRGEVTLNEQQKLNDVSAEQEVGKLDASDVDACGDYLEDKDVPGYCEGCSRPKSEHMSDYDIKEQNELDNQGRDEGGF